MTHQKIVPPKFGSVAAILYENFNIKFIHTLKYMLNNTWKRDYIPFPLLTEYNVWHYHFRPFLRTLNWPYRPLNAMQYSCFTFGTKNNNFYAIHYKKFIDIYIINCKKITYLKAFANLTLTNKCGRNFNNSKLYIL